MNECMRGRPSRPLHRDLVVYCASPFSIVPSATQRFGHRDVKVVTTTRQGLDLVEGTTPSETEKESASRGGTGNVETPASTE
jgi:hypothetical protein